ncbi:MAG TPA: hypothetical protein VK157_17910, partial [Phycisphaerales bacterium]|nr:hypothetical protein [Phycisphaerales bacterium]
MRVAALLFFTAMLSLPVAASAQAQSFTYQGRLDTAGIPAAAAHDFEFRVFSTSAGNTQVGTTTTVLNVTPINGVFTATVAPGANAFTGADRWLEVAVRSAGSPAFTTLTPRQHIAATPYAARSLSERLTDIGGGVLTNDGSVVNRLILNRTTPVTGADYFTLRTPTGQEQFGGMYVDTAPGDGFPFYGFATGGTVRAFAYVEGTTGLFKLNVGSDRVSITNTGLVGIGMTPT